MVALTTLAIACSRSGSGGDSARAGEGAPPAPDSGTPPLAADSARATPTPGSGGTAGTGSGTGSARSPQRPSPSEPPNDVRPSIPRDGKVAPAGGQRDTVRGVPGIEGSERFRRVSIEGSGGAITQLTGDRAEIVGRLSGLDVWVSGTRDDRGALVVERFAVRGADGRAARDGVLERSGDEWFLRLADGSRSKVLNPPPALRERVGERVWVSGPADAPPISFGFIEKPR